MKSSVLINISETKEKFFVDFRKGFPSFPGLMSVGIKTRATSIIFVNRYHMVAWAGSRFWRSSLLLTPGPARYPEVPVSSPCTDRHNVNERTLNKGKTTARCSGCG